MGYLIPVKVTRREYVVIEEWRIDSKQLEHDVEVGFNLRYTVTKEGEPLIETGELCQFDIDWDELLKGVRD